MASGGACAVEPAFPEGAGLGRKIVPQVLELPECHLADCMMSVAESRSVQALGAACQHAIEQLTGSSTIGLYLLEAAEPDLVYSRQVEQGFLDNYKAGFWQRDPVLDCILSDGRTVDGASLLGPRGWPRSTSFEMLQHWGFSNNMGGPLWCEDKIVGVLFTATRDAGVPYTASLRHRMEILCRAGSLALRNITNANRLDAGLVSGAALYHRRMLPSSALSYATLPPRSADVAFRVCRGQTNKEIARDMGISDQTVKEHVAKLCKRFGTHNRTELVVCLLSGMSRQ
jgi:DNA-binding CsgD family transcriptional regulator